jgi:membrane associated rhomboid family serine protease
MIPIGDAGRRFGFPWITSLLVLVLIVFFVVEHRASEDEWDELVKDHVLTPAAIARGLGVRELANTLTCLPFQGQGWHQPIANILFLWVLGRKIEDACGPWGLLVLCVLAGAGGIVSTGLALRLLPAGSQSELIYGPAGIVAGLMGAYFVLYQMKSIRTYIPPFMLLPIPAFVHLLYWGGLEFIRIRRGRSLTAGLIALDHKWPLIGALLVGMAVSQLLARREILYARISKRGLGTP